MRCCICESAEVDVTVIGLGNAYCGWCIALTIPYNYCVDKIVRCSCCHVLKEKEELAFSYYNQHNLCEECYGWCLAYGS